MKDKFHDILRKIVKATQGIWFQGYLESLFSVPVYSIAYKIKT